LFWINITILLTVNQQCWRDEVWRRKAQDFTHNQQSSICHGECT
jgi:hypothetical protein